MEKVQNLLNFSDFEKSWKAKEPKKTKRTEVGLDIIEEKFLDEDEIIEDELIDDDELIDQDEEELIDVDELESDDDGEEEDWKERIIALVDEIVEGGVDPEEVYEFLDELGDEYEGEDEGEEIDIDEDEDENDEEIIDEEEVADDEEGEEVQESVKNFKNWSK